jgi:predicted RNA binding protein YcfA (HicA-like mRNA interferase family)
MPKMKVVGGKDLIKFFAKHGFEKIDQRGNHVKIRRIGPSGKKTLTIPVHAEIDRGLLKQIFLQASRYISESDLRAYFYHKN